MINYILLMKKVLAKGQSHNGTLSLFGEGLSYDLRRGFPIVTTRKINYKAALGELACFLKGETDVREFQKKDVNFWNADCSKSSWQENPHCKNEFDLGEIYGYQWRRGFGFDQLEKIIHDLKTNPSSRRHLLMTFNPASLDKGCLPPCYVSHQFYVSHGKFLDMMVHQRSADLCIGVPFDLVSFAMFQHIIAKETGLIARELKVVFGDVHIYDSHVELAQCQKDRPHKTLPFLTLNTVSGIKDFRHDKIKLYGYHYHSPIKYNFEVQQ